MSANLCLPKLAKCPTGISGLDEVTGGGLPRGRLTLVCGGAGCGKTLFGLEFIVRGAVEFGEPGVVMSFDETPDELAQNVASLGFDLRTLIAEKKLAIIHTPINPQEQMTGHFDLEPLFVRLEHAINKVGARRMSLDTLEAIFGNSFAESILRAEIQRLFRWIKDRGVTAVVTGERGHDQLTRHGLEEYISDCVISLDNRIIDQVTTRRLRVVKYRGTAHGSNEYPFMFGADGISVLPVTSIALDHEVSLERISSGIPRLDTMLGGDGFFRGSSILLSGTAGTGKTTLASHFVRAACARQERCLYFAFEEAPGQIRRNLKSVGVDLDAPSATGLLTFEANRPTATGLEAHLLFMHKAVEAIKPSVVVVDPLNAFISGNNALDVKAMLVRLIDFLKHRGITALFTSLTSGGNPMEGTDTEVSSLIDSWLILRDIETSGERNRGLMILKSRGMAHSNQIREFKLTDEGIVLCDVFVGEDGVLMGTARLAKEAEEALAQRRRSQDIHRFEKALADKERAFQAQTVALQAAYSSERDQLKQAVADLKEQERSRGQCRAAQAQNRFADSSES
ncbi:MAG: circadian clock protein KaiC [Rhodospirillaceae bacterium]